MSQVWHFLSEVFRPSLVSHRYTLRKYFSTNRFTSASHSDHLITPESRFLDQSHVFTPQANQRSSDGCRNDDTHRFDNSFTGHGKNSVIFYEPDALQVSSEELEEAWDLLEKVENSKCMNLESKLKSSRATTRKTPVYTPSQAPIITTSSREAGPSYQPNASTGTPSSHGQSDFPSLEWRTRANSQVKFSYSQVSQTSCEKKPACSTNLASASTVDGEEEAWAMLDKNFKTSLTQSQVICQARTVGVDPYAREAGRYVESWSKVMELERQTEALAAMKRLYDIRLKSANRYNPLGKALVDMVVSPTDPPIFTKPEHKNHVYLRVERADESEIGLCNFRIGDHLLLSAEPPESFDDEATPIESMPKVFSQDIFIPSRLVLKRTYHLILRLENSDLDLRSDTYRLDYGWDGTSFDRTSAAVESMLDDPDALRKNLSKKDIEKSNIKITGTSLRHPLLYTTDEKTSKTDSRPIEAPSPLSEFHLFTRDQRINSWARRHLRHPHLKMPGDPDLDHLNEPQTQAIAMAISSPLSLIQGPPGTGKTQTIIQMVALLKLHFQVSQPIAVCAPTHVSVDNLVIGLAKAGLKPVRCGEYFKVSHEVTQYSLETLETHHPLTPTIENKTRRLESLTKDLDAIEKRWRSNKPTVSSKAKPMTNKQEKVVEIMKTEYKRLSYEVYALKRRRQSQIIASTDVVCCTCLGAGASILEPVEFASVIIDEAAMCHEPTALVPLTKGSAHAVLVGDHKQLPAITLSPAADARGFGVSLFERLQSQQNVPSILLHKQYRMDPVISAFPNAEFYDNALVDSIVPSAIRPVYFHHDQSIEPQLRSRAVSFVTHNHPETKLGKTLINALEAEIVFSIVRDLLRTNSHLTGHDIGIITPYRGQVSLLQSLQRQPQKASLIRNLEQSYHNEVEINTVDGFQGREKPVIILSGVRGNDHRQIGFLADLRRFNVAATRAKQKFIVVGHLDTLEYADVSRYLKFGGHYNAESWRRWVRWARDENLLIDSKKFQGS